MQPLSTNIPLLSEHASPLRTEVPKRVRRDLFVAVAPEASYINRETYLKDLKTTLNTIKLIKRFAEDTPNITKIGLLLTDGINPNCIQCEETLLMNAIDCLNTHEAKREILHKLVEIGCNVSQTINYCIRTDQPFYIYHLLDALYPGENPLFVAIKTNDIPLLTYFLSKGRIVNSKKLFVVFFPCFPFY